jgi:hypothetical protein
MLWNIEPEEAMDLDHEDDDDVFTITNITMVRSFGVATDKFNVVGI